MSNETTPRQWAQLDANGLSPWQRLDELDRTEVRWLVDEFRSYIRQKTTLMPRRKRKPAVAAKRAQPIQVAKRPAVIGGR